MLLITRRPSEAFTVEGVATVTYLDVLSKNVITLSIDFEDAARPRETVTLSVPGDLFILAPNVSFSAVRARGRQVTFDITAPLYVSIRRDDAKVKRRKLSLNKRRPEGAL